VEDPYLEKHLAHFGIHIAEMQKSDKTIKELEIEQNMNFDWSRLQEKDKALQPIFGPGYTGLNNLGNSCYMASVLQTVFSLPEFKKRYYANAEAYFQSAPQDPTSDFQTQMAKVAKGILSGDYSKENEKEPVGITPRMFKTLIGTGHREFSSNHQQDALEFFQHLMTTVERDQQKTPGELDPSKLFQLQIEERIKCTASGKVKYTRRSDNVLSLSIPLHKATNQGEVQEYQKRIQQEKKEDEELAKNGKPKRERPKEDPVRPRVPLSACLEAFGYPEEIPDFYSSAVKRKTTAIKDTRISAFPDYLVIAMRKFYVSEDWSPKKLDVYIDVPDFIDLEFLRGRGIQPNEVLLPEDAPASASPAFTPDQSIIEQLTLMGFPRERCVKAAYHTKNAGPEPATNWIFEHMDDADIDVPLQIPSSAPTGKSVDEESVAMLVSMGFTDKKAIKALQETDGNLERATDWIFCHAGGMDIDSSPAEQTGVPAIKDGNGVYRLKAFISHMGTSTQSGHYVCHILKDGKWVLFNDSKVALSEQPPKDMGYMYIFERV